MHHHLEKHFKQQGGECVLSCTMTMDTVKTQFTKLSVMNKKLKVLAFSYQIDCGIFLEMGMMWIKEYVS